ncbi:MAG: YdeI/OmpD-associated family protein [Acidobacteriaceae bacterium]
MKVRAIMLAGMAARQRFNGVLERDGTSLGWTIVRVPFDPCEVWPERNRLRVKGTINGFAFRTSLFRMQTGTFFLLVNKPMQKGGGVTLGSLANVVLEPDLEERPVETPPELERFLREDRTLRKWHGALSPSSRKWIADWIAQPKSADTRARRAEQMAERMLLTMEGERIAPPILEAAFQRAPRAREAWRGLTPNQRRGHLLGIFYYQSPEGRQKRTQKAIEEALRMAEKKAAKGKSPSRR